MTKEEILSTYRSKLRVYTDLKETLERMLKTILSEKNRGIQNTSVRIKEIDSLEKKIDKKGYISFDEITDIVAARVITYFEDDVNEVGDMIANAFEVDVENSVDKSLQLQADQFGYKSLHYVMQFSDDSCRRPEYKAFSGIKFEVQIRSILQHAWAEIEHDLKYKSEREVPSEIRRRFSRLAGLLELADEEFINIRRKRKEYRESVENIIDGSIDRNIVETNLDSLELFMKSRLVIKISEQVANFTRVKFDADFYNSPNNNIVSAFLYIFTTLGFKHIQQIERYMIAFEKEIVHLGASAIRDTGLPVVNADLSMFFTMYHVLIRNDRPDLFNIYAKMVNLQSDGTDIYLKFKSYL